MSRPAITRVGRDRPKRIQSIAAAMFDATNDEASCKVSNDVFSAFEDVIEAASATNGAVALATASLAAKLCHDLQRSSEDQTVTAEEIVDAFGAFVKSVIADHRKRAAS